jgi:glycosyltransferase involved in cell wall biosynthesis
VAIGRNEGERLRRCLASLVGVPGLGPTVYVDSGSTDGSVEMARSMGVDVIELDMSRPFSAARARNEGFWRLKAIDADLRYAMFVDGDCEVVDGWLARGRAELEARPTAAVVCGLRREMYPEASVYNRLADLEWDTPIGEALACGGDSRVRAEAFEAVGGFNPTAPAGEEPELCQRLRGAGWSIWRIDADMTRHDLAMYRFRQWWRRQYRSGYNGLDIVTRFPNPDNIFVKGVMRSRIWGIGWPLAIIVAGLVGRGLAGPLAGGLAALLVVLVMPLQILRLAAKVRNRVDRFSTALAYGFFMMAAKWADLAGQAGYLIDRRRGKMARLIEYKRVGDSEPARDVAAAEARP